MGVSSVGISLDRASSLCWLASRSDESACLVIDTDGTYCEIEMDREHVEDLRDQLPGVLAGLDQWATEQAGCERAEVAEQRAADAVSRALELAEAAGAAGDHHLTGSLREAVAEAAAKAEAVHAAVTAFERATAEADDATEKLVHLTGQAWKEHRDQG